MKPLIEDMASETDSDRGAPIRVVAITPTHVFSGAERVLVGHATAGKHAGDRWTILSPPGAITDQLAANDLEHLVIPELKLGHGSRPLAGVALAYRNLRSIRLVRRAIRDADVIVANSVLSIPVLLLARPAAPVVWLVHDVITRPDLAWIARLCARVVSLSIPVSKAAGKLSRELGIETTVVYNGVDPSDVDAEPVEPPIVGLNAVLTHWKGQHVLLDAMGMVERPFTVELMGGTLPKDEAYEQSLIERSDRPDLRGKVRLLGHQNDPADVMRHWSVAVSASVEPEAGPLSILEAMALGIAVVVSDHGAAPEMVGECGAVVPVADAAALAQMIERLLADTESTREMGYAGRNRMRSKFLREDRERQFRSLLSDIADRTQPGGDR